jgi:chemotaxis family two-component system response regulator Rcp1
VGRKSLAKRKEIMNAMAQGSMPLQVLLVEDNPADVLLTREAFSDSQTPIFLHVASDGVEAMAFLRREGSYVDAPFPDLILLDLNLPRINGCEVLAHIKADDKLKNIPTLILTASEAEADVARSYQLHANCYLSKPAKFDAFGELARSIREFWLTKLPPRRRLLGEKIRANERKP